ncbi:collagen-binding domain-containing protein, partial [Listeria booriae]
MKKRFSKKIGIYILLIFFIFMLPLKAIASSMPITNISNSIYDYNGIVLGNHIVHTADTEGSIAVKHDIVNKGSFTYGGAASGAYNIVGQPYLNKNTPGLLLGGNIQGNKQRIVVEGNGFYHNAAADTDAEVQIKDGESKILNDAELERLFQSFDVQINNNMQKYSSLVDCSPTRELVFQTSKKNAEVLVVNLSAETSKIQEIDLPDLSNYSQVIIKADASKISFANGAILYNGKIVDTSSPNGTNPVLDELASKITWVFPNATNLNMNSYGVIGDVYAPNANSVGNGGSILGSLYTKNLEQLNGFELHAPYSKRIPKTPEGETPTDPKTPEGETPTDPKTPEGETPTDPKTPEGETPTDPKTPEGETPTDTKTP